MYSLIIASPHLTPVLLDPQTLFSTLVLHSTPEIAIPCREVFPVVFANSVEVGIEVRLRIKCVRETQGRNIVLIEM